jgi:hypothetical protein
MHATPNGANIMVQVVVTADQARLMTESHESVEIVDENGRRLGTVVRPPNDEDVRIARQRVDQSGNRYSTAEVVSHLQSLEKK